MSEELFQHSNLENKKDVIAIVKLKQPKEVKTDMKKQKAIKQKMAVA